MKDKSQATILFKLLADPTRYEILNKLYNTNKDLCVNEIAQAVGISHSAASHQLAKLEAKDIVRSVRNGQTMCYMLQKNAIADKIETLIRTAS